MTFRTGHLLAGAVIALAVAGCGSGSGTGTGSSSAGYRAIPDLTGVRTADGGRALVVTYTAGACDKVPAVRAAESTSLVTISAAIPSDCVRGHLPRTLKFPLSTPVTDPRVQNGPDGATVTAFNGAVLTDPAQLPAGYRQDTPGQHHDPDGGWTRIWLPAAGAAGDELEITQTPHRLPTPAGVAVPGRFVVDGQPATVTRDAATRTLSVQWDTRDHARSSRVSAVQAGAAATLTPAELLAIANSLPTRG